MVKYEGVYTMNDKILLGIISILFLVGGLNTGGLDIGRSYTSDYGSEVEFLMNLNSRVYDLQNVRMNVFIPELGLLLRPTKFDIDAGDHLSYRLTTTLPAGTKPGFYPVRISVHTDDHYRSVDHAWLSVR
jgi:uncharacterized membrane protein